MFIHYWLSCVRSLLPVSWLPPDVACDCGAGASGAVCQAYGGQCPCEPQVVGRDCSFCRASSFGISENGCSGMFVCVRVHVCACMCACVHACV